MLDRLVAGNPDLLIDRNRVDVGGVRRKRHVRAGSARFVDYLLDQEVGAVRTFVLEHAVDRVQPFTRFLRVDIRLDIHAGHSLGDPSSGRAKFRL